jgi:hypothetical protein
MKYRIKEVTMDDEVSFYPQQKKSWLDPWRNVGYSRFPTLEGATAELDSFIARAKREELRRNPPTRYHSYKN